MQVASLTSDALDALASQCRDSSFRASLEDSPLWQQVTTTLQNCIDGIDAAFTRPGQGGSSDGNPRIATSSDGSARSRGGGNDDADEDDDEDDGLSYSFTVPTGAGMDELTANRFASSTAIQVDDVATAMLLVSQATSAFRFLRNACAMSPSNQEACRTHELIHKAHTLVMRCCSWSDVDEAALSSAVILLAQVALQFSVNSITGCVKNQQVIWTLYFPENFQQILVECHAHRKIIAFTVALMLNCINKTLDDDAVSARRIELVEARNVVITLLQRCLSRPTDTSHHHHHQELHVDDHNDPAFEWLCLLFKALFEAGYSKPLYNAVGAHLLSKLWSRVTPEQLILLRMFTMWMTSHRGGDSSPSSATTATTRSQASIGPISDEAMYLEIVTFVALTWQYIVSRETEDRPEEADETRKLMWLEFENEAKMLLLDVLGELTLKRVETSAMAELMEQLLGSLLEELKDVWTLRRLGSPAPPRPQPLTTTATAGGSSSISGLAPTRESLGLPAGEPVGYRSALIRVLGNLSYRHTNNQDRVREGGFLPLFLNHCNIDEANPMLREWSLVALRNLCEGNEANQQYITALRPQGIDRASVDLDSLHVDAALDDEGKLRVQRKE